MKDFVIGVLVTAAIIVACSCIDVAAAPEPVVDGSGTHSAGESDLVLPGSGPEVAEIPAVSPESEVPGGSSMTDAEKLALIDTILADAFAHFGSMDDTQVWKGVALVISDVIKFGGVSVG